MRFLAGALTAVAVLALAVALTVFGGWYDVAATEPHTGFTEAMLDRLQHASVGSRADEVEVPDLAAANLDEGFVHFDEMCVTCHGAPGIDRSEIGQGMTPTPPDLAEEGEEWSDAELFWITRNGIKLAGMPAFGPTHSDEQLWGIVAIVRRLPEMSPEDYAALRDSVGGESGGHQHGPGAAPHSHDEGGG